MLNCLQHKSISLNMSTSMQKSNLKRHQGFDRNTSNKEISHVKNTQNSKRSVSFNTAIESRTFVVDNDDNNFTPRTTISLGEKVDKDYDSNISNHRTVKAGEERYHLAKHVRKTRSHRDYEENDKTERKRQKAKRRAMDYCKYSDEENEENDKSIKKKIRSSSDFFDGEELNDSHSEVSLLNENWASSKNDFDEKSKTSTSKIPRTCEDRIPIEPFNLIQEREEGDGYFDGDTYVFRKKGGNHEVDAWVDNLDSDYKSKFEAEYNTLDKNKKLKSSTKIMISTNEILTRILNLMNTDQETIEEAIKRLGKEKSKIKKQNKIKNSNQDSSVLRRIDDSLSQIIDYANSLLMRNDGFNDIYQYTKHRISTMLFSRSADVQKVEIKKEVISKLTHNYFHDEKDENQQTESSQDQWDWFYKGNGDNQIHGPFTTQEMLAWTKGGYFVGDNAVDISFRKKCANNKQNEKGVNDLMDDLLSDDEGKEKETRWVRSDKINFSNFL